MTPKKESGSRFYRPRNPVSSPFYKLAEKYFNEFEQVYPERYGMRFGFWRPVIREAIDKFLDKGLLDLDTIESMMAWRHSGFSIDTSVRIEADDRAGMQRLIEYKETLRNSFLSFSYTLFVYFPVSLLIGENDQAHG